MILKFFYFYKMLQTMNKNVTAIRKNYQIDLKDQVVIIKAIYDKIYRVFSEFFFVKRSSSFCHF
jgi:hypothetical protein